MGQRFTLSFSDIKMANLAYNCDGIVQMGETIFNFLNINYQLADLLITTKKFSEAEKHLEAICKS
jgi:hypothetical protein